MSRRTIVWTVGLGVPLALLAGLDCQPHLLGRRHRPDAAQRRGRHQPVLCGATVRRSARRARDARSHVQRARSGRRHRALDLELEPERAAAADARAVGGVGRTPGRGRHRGRWRGVRPLVRHPDARAPAPARTQRQRAGRALFQVSRRAARRAQSARSQRPHWLCDVDRGSTLSTSRAVEWALDDPKVGTAGAAGAASAAAASP